MKARMTYSIDVIVDIGENWVDEFGNETDDYRVAAWAKFMKGHGAMIDETEFEYDVEPE